METIHQLLDSRPTLTYICAGVVTSASIYFLRRSLRDRGYGNEQVTAPPGTVILHHIPRATYCPSLSPFPIKLESFLRLNNIPYVHDFKNYKSPKGKLPYITYNGQVVSDSQLCIEFLKEKLGVDLDQSLSEEQKAVSTALRVLVDEHLYWFIVYFRWAEKNYDNRVFKENIPLPYFVYQMIKRKLVKQMYAQGIGRHTREEILMFLRQDLTSLDGYLGNKQFLMGDDVTEVDCAVFGSLCQFVYMQDDPYTKGLVHREFPRLVDYTERFKAKVWPDWEEVTRCGSKFKQA